MSGRSVAAVRDRGIVYVAIGSRYRREAALSARSVRAFLPDIPTLLLCDERPDDGDAWDEIVLMPERQSTPHLDKIAGMMRSPFRDTLFLDTDTYVLGPLTGIFDLLGRFDMAMALDRSYRDVFPPDTGVPDIFCEYNQGVVAFRQSARMRAMFQQSLDWAADFQARTGTAPTDQAAMRIALYRSDLRIATLPHEYNCRFHSYGALNGSVRILHGRIPGTRQKPARLVTIARKLNGKTVPRVFVAGRVHALARRRLRADDHYFPRRMAILFRPGRMLAKARIKRLARALQGMLKPFRPGV